MADLSSSPKIYALSLMNAGSQLNWTVYATSNNLVFQEYPAKWNTQWPPGCEMGGGYDSQNNNLSFTYECQDQPEEIATLPNCVYETTKTGATITCPKPDDVATANKINAIFGSKNYEQASSNSSTYQQNSQSSDYTWLWVLILFIFLIFVIYLINRTK
jgi:hypothetical protein